MYMGKCIFKELVKMAENIEEIAVLIENLKRENKNSNEDFINILNDISSKLNNIQNNNGETGSVLSNIQQTLSSKIQVDNDKLNELDNTLEKLKTAIYSVTDYSELTEEVKTLAENFKSGFNSVINFANKDADAKNILMDRIQALENAVKDGAMVEALKQRTDDLVKGYENFISDSNLRHGNMVSALVDLKNKIDDYASKSNYALATIEHSMNDANSKIMNLESTVSSNLGNVNSKLYSLGDDLQKILNDSFDHLKYLSSNMSEAMNSSSLDFKTTIEALKANVLSFSDNLKDEFSALSTRINNKIDDVHEEDSLIDKDTLDKVKELENTLLSKANEYESSLSDKFNILTNFVDALKETVVSVKVENNEILSDKLSDLSNEIRTISSNFEQLMTNSADEIKTVSKTITKNSEEIVRQLKDANAEEIITVKNELLNSSGSNFSAIVEKIQGIDNNIENFKNTTSENLTEYLKSIKEMFVDFSGDINISADNTEILDKLNNLEIIMSRFDIEKNDNFNHLQILIENNKNAIEDLKNNTQNSQNIENIKAVIEEHSRNKDEKLENLREAVDNYQNKVDSFSANIQSQSENTLRELSELKSITSEVLNKNPEFDRNQELIEQLTNDIQSQSENTLRELSELKSIANEVLYKQSADTTNDSQELIEKLASDIQIQSEVISNELAELKLQINNISNKNNETDNYSDSVEKLSAELKNQLDNTFNELTELKVLTADVLTKKSDFEDFAEVLNGKVGDCKDKISEEAAAIKNSISTIKEGLVELSPIIEINEISTKLSNIEHQFAEAFENYDLSLSILNVRLNEYTESLANSKGLSTSDMVNYEAEFDEIRTQFEEMSEKMSGLVGNSGLIEILANIRQQFNVIDKTFKAENESSVADIKQTLDEVVSIINNNLYLIGQNIEAIYVKQSEVSENIVTSLNTNLDSIKSNINSLTENIDETVETRMLAVVKDFEPLKDAINNFTKTDFSEIVSEVKEAVELSYVNLANEIKEKLGSTEVIDNVEQGYKNSVDHLDVLEDILQNSIQTSIDSINNTLLNIHNTTQNSASVLEDIQSGFQTDIMLLEKKVQEFANSTNETITTQLEEIKEYLANSANATPEDIKNIIAPLFDNDELIDTVRTVNKSLADKITELKQDGDLAAQEINEIVNSIKTTVNDTVNLINDKFENSGKNANQIIENLGEINNKFEVLVMASNDDTVKNTVAEITKKTDDTNKNIEQVIETLTRIDVKSTTDLEYLRAIIEEVVDSTEDIANHISFLDDINSKLNDNKPNEYNDVSVPVEEIRLKVEELRKNINDILGFEVILRELILKLDIIATETDNEEIIDDIDTIKNAVLGYKNHFNKSDENISYLTGLAKTIDSKLDIIAQADNEDVLSDIANVKDGLKTLSDKLDIIAQADNEDVLSDIANVKDSLKTLSDKLDIIAQADNEDVLNDIAEVKENFGRIEYKIDCLNQLSYDQLKPETDNIKNELSNIKNDIKALTSRIDIISQTDSNDDILDEIDNLRNIITITENKLDIIAQSSDNEDVILADLEQVQEDIKTLTKKFDLELKSNDNLFGADISDIKQNMKELYSNVDNIKSSLSDAISNQDYVDKESFKNELNELKNQLISTESNLENYSRTLDCKLDEISQFNGVNDKLNNISDGSIHIKDLVKELNTKVDILAMSDDSVILDEISEIKQVIESQIDTIRQTTLEESSQNSDELKNMMSELERIDNTIKSIDLTGSTTEIKNAVITTIKSFVDERTNEIQHVLMEVKRQLTAISNSNDDMDLYTYTMQDVESDLAKLRLVVNDMSNKVGDNEISVVSTNLNKMTRTIENLQQAIIASGLDKTTSANLGEQVTSISSRLNQLILTQQEIIKDEQLRNSIISKNLQKTIEDIDKKLEYLTNIITILKNVMMYLGEWMDGTTDTLEAIYNKCNIENTIKDLNDTVKASTNLFNSSMEKIQEVVSSRLESIEKTYENRIAKQEERLDRIEKQLDKICNAIDSSSNYTVTNDRIDEIEERLIRLSNNIEKLTAYVE